ncbi:MAG: MFS transporter [Pirellulales bacterium]
MTDTAAAAKGKASGREIFAWAMYDWANSAYTTLSITALMFFLTEVVASADSPIASQLSDVAATFGQHVPTKAWGGIVWAWGLALAMFVVAVLSPIVGAMADARATKRWWLAGTALSGAVCPIVMYFVPATSAWTHIALFVLASLLFDLSFGFYNGFLPELADERTMNRISAWGYALGYLGGGLALLIELQILDHGDDIGIVGKPAQLQFGLLLMGVWWGVFTLPAVLWLRDRSPPTAPRASLLRSAKDAVTQVKRTIKNVRRFPMLVLFLVGFLFYNDGIQTVIGQAGSFARADLDFEAPELLKLILVFQFICILGAMIDSVLTDRIGQKRALMLYLGIWVISLASAYFITEKVQFWWLSGVLGLVMGGAQTVSRSIMAMMTPERHNAEFFGFFNFSGKATAWMGNLTFGFVIYGTGSARLAIMSLFVFFVIGWAFAAMVDVARGRREALTAEVQ